MPASGEDLDLLLSLGGDKVPETPPGSPSSSHSHNRGFVSDDGSPRRPRVADMSVFRDAVKDYLDSELSAPDVLHSNPKTQNKSHEVQFERFSGLRIRNQLVSSVELSNRFSDVRFVRMSAIRNLLSGDTLSGSWATVGVLIEKGAAKVSSAGKSYCIWKMGCLDEVNVSVFLFGDAYSRNCAEMVGTVFALFNLNVRKDGIGKGFTLSLNSVGQILKMGTSSDFGICKSKRKDGVACSMAINKNQGLYCKYHSSKASQKYTTARAELKGGNLQMALRSELEGVYVLNPKAGQSNRNKSVQPVKVMSVDGLKKVLSAADKLTTNRHSQGIRFLSDVTANMGPKLTDEQVLKPNKIKPVSGKRPSIATNLPSNQISRNGLEAKKKKACHSSVNMIELDVISSDEER